MTSPSRCRSSTYDRLPNFKRLMHTSADDDMDQLARRYTGYYQYAKILAFDQEQL